MDPSLFISGTIDGPGIQLLPYMCQCHFTAFLKDRITQIPNGTQEAAHFFHLLVPFALVVIFTRTRHDWLWLHTERTILARSNTTNSNNANVAALGNSRCRRGIGRSTSDAPTDRCYVSDTKNYVGNKDTFNNRFNASRIQLLQLDITNHRSNRHRFFAITSHRRDPIDRIFHRLSKTNPSGWLSSHDLQANTRETPWRKGARQIQPTPHFWKSIKQTSGMSQTQPKVSTYNP